MVLPKSSWNTAVAEAIANTVSKQWTSLTTSAVQEHAHLHSRGTLQDQEDLKLPFKEPSSTQRLQPVSLLPTGVPFWKHTTRPLIEQIWQFSSDEVISTWSHLGWEGTICFRILMQRSVQTIGGLSAKFTIDSISDALKILSKSLSVKLLPNYFH